MEDIKFRARVFHSEIYYFIYFNIMDTGILNQFDQVLEINRCTGIKDKNGKEIYEGDIIRFYGNYTINKKCGWHIGVIKWDKSQLKFNIVYNNVVWDISETDEFEDKTEVIGNIYENLELLKGKKNEKIS